MFTKDPSRPGGGVFVAREKPSDDLVRELPEGTIISATGETITAAVSNVRTPNDDVSMSLPANASSSSPAAGAAYGGNKWSWSSTSGHAHSGSSTASPQQQHPQAQAQQAGSSSASMVNLSTMGGNGSGATNYQNMNPALNNAVSGGPENVQILNMLDYAPQGNPVQSFQVTDQVTDPGFFTSIPASMYDYSKYPTFVTDATSEIYGYLIVLYRSMGKLFLKVRDWDQLDTIPAEPTAGDSTGYTATIRAPTILSSVWRIFRRRDGEWDLASYIQHLSSTMLSDISSFSINSPLF